MTQLAKILVLVFSLILPYMAFGAYMGLTLRGKTLPLWFPYAALGYLVVAIFVFKVAKKRILANSPKSGDRHVKNSKRRNYPH